MIGDTRTQLGFTAQNIQQVFPSVVSVVDPVSGYLGVDYVQLITPTIGAVQELNIKIEGLADISVPLIDANGEDSFVGKVFKRIAVWLSDTSNGIVKMFAKSVETEELCVADGSGAKTCITKTQLDALLAGVAGTTDTTTESTAPADESTGEALDIEPPVITVNGGNPAEIAQGSTYSDMGASVEDNMSNNLGVTAEGIEAVDTTTPGSYSITYTAVDQAGNTTTATREVIVLAPEVPEPAIEPEPEPTATSTPQE